MTNYAVKVSCSGSQEESVLSALSIGF